VEVTDTLARNREGKVRFREQDWKGVSREAVNCVLSLCEKRPARRPTAREALELPWFRMNLPHPPLPPLKDPLKATFPISPE